MNLRHGFLLLISLSSLFAQTAHQAVFVSAEQLNVAAILGNPPAAGSKEMTAELAQLHQLQSGRTAERMAQAKRDDAEEDIFIYANVLGEKFNREVLPATVLLSSHVHNDEGIVVNPAKNFFHRPRPFKFDATISPICKIGAGAAEDSYPSGHSVTGYLEALTLLMIVPEKRDEILLRADDYAQNRLVCGVHYPSDLRASKAVAYAMMALMMNNPQFKKELENAWLETRHALGLQTSAIQAAGQ